MGIPDNNTGFKEEDKSQKILEDSEDLVRIAIDNNVAITQIRNMYERARTKEKTDFQVFLKYQMRRSDFKQDRKILPRVFGDKVLHLYEKYQYEKRDLITILKYTVMLYEYEKNTINNSKDNNISGNNNKYWNSQQHNQSPLNQHKLSLSNDIGYELRQRIEQIIKTGTINYGFNKVDLDVRPASSTFADQRRQAALKVNVHLKKVYGNLKWLSDNLKDLLYTNIPELSAYDIKIWIEKGEL